MKPSTPDGASRLRTALLVSLTLVAAVALPSSNAVAATTPADGRPNQTPVFSEDLGDRSDAVGTLISISAAATDSDLEDTLTYTADGLPIGIAIDSATGQLTGAPGVAAEGTHFVTITVRDDASPPTEAVDTFEWTITAGAITYLVASTGGGIGGDQLTAVNPTNPDPATNEINIGAGTGTTNIQAAAVDPATATLFAAAGGQLGTIDVTTGAFTPLSQAVGTGDGAAGSVAFDDIEGLAFDPHTGHLYATQRRGEGNEDLLFRIEPTTGAHVSGAYRGDDYAVIQSQDGRYHVAGMSFDPTDGRLYAIHGTALNSSAIVTLDPITGAVAAIGTAPDHVNGLAFDDFGRMLASTAGAAGELLYELDKVDGTPISAYTIDNGSMYTAVAVAASQLNQPPLFAQDLPDRSDPEGVTISVSTTAVDGDPGSTLNYAATGLPGGIVIDPATGLISGTIAFGESGTHNVEIIVTDDGVPTRSDIDGFVWTVTNTNRAPVLEPIPSLLGPEEMLLTFTASASDPDGDAITYTLAGAPAGARIDSSSGVFTWTPNETHGTGSYAITVIATDDTTAPLATTETVAVTITEVNRTPTIDLIADQSSAVGNRASLAVVARDADLPQNTIRYNAYGLPPGLSLNAATGLISGTIPPEAVGTHTVSVIVIDDGTPSLAGGTTFTWTVSSENAAPLLAPLPDLIVAEETRVEFRAGALDPDGDAVTFAITDAPEGASIHPATGVFTWTPTEAQGPGDHTFTVSATDNGDVGLTGSRDVTITVLEVNAWPEIAPIADRADVEGTEVALEIHVTDADIPANTFTFSAIALPPGLTIDGDTGLIHGVIGEATSDVTEYSVLVTVSDNGTPILKAATGFKWTVRTTEAESEDTAPQVTPVADQYADAGTPINLAVHATDTAEIGFSASGLPPGLTIDPRTGVITGTVTTIGTYEVVVLVAGEGEPPAQTTVSFSLTVIDRAAAEQKTDLIVGVGTSLAPATASPVRSGLVVVASVAAATAGSIGLPLALLLVLLTGFITAGRINPARLRRRGRLRWGPADE